MPNIFLWIKPKLGETGVVDDNPVDTNNINDGQATTEETPAGIELGGREGRTEFI